MSNKLNLNLIGKDGNAFALLDYFTSKAHKAGWSEEQIDAVIVEATKGDYDHLIQTLIKQ